MTKPDDPNRVLIFDTTLRDGEQSPGISLNTAEKLDIAQQLARLSVDVIEAGFPVTSPGDFEAVETIARQVEGPVIAGLARTHVADIDAAYEAVKDSERPRVHTFISTSDIPIEHKLQTTRDDVKGQARAAVAHAKEYVDDVEFSPMDATRADVEFTAEVCQIAIDEGATTINIPDTVGYTMPLEFAEYLGRLYGLAPALRDVVLSVHCHEAGIHQDGVLKERTTYEIMDATTVGLDANSIVLGKHSGRHALQQALSELGLEIAGQALNTAFKRFKEIADKKKQVTAMDLEALVTDELRSEDIGGFTLYRFEVEASSLRPPHAKVSVTLPEGGSSTGSFTGDGPLDAV